MPQQVLVPARAQEPSMTTTSEKKLRRKMLIVHNIDSHLARSSGFRKIEWRSLFRLPKSSRAIGT